MSKKLFLQNHQSPGDIIMMTCAVRDLMNAYPGQYEITVDTSCPAVWENNPFISDFDQSEADYQIEMQYPLIHKSNSTAYHFSMAFTDYLSNKLDKPIPYGENKGDIYISDKEKSWYSQVYENTDEDTEFWIIVAGSKLDFTNKQWSIKRYQEVVNQTKDDIFWVQVGAEEHPHPDLDNVLDLRGKTDFRELIRLVYHSSGVLCPVTCLMHLAEAVPTRPDFNTQRRPCVVVAGGREPVRWEAYGHHQFLHTCGALPCCDKGGCWKSRIEKLDDGSKQDNSLCLHPTTDGNNQKIPKCMDMIKTKDVVRAINLYKEIGRK